MGPCICSLGFYEVIYTLENGTYTLTPTNPSPNDPTRTTCNACPANATTLQTNTMSVLECICEAGFYGYGPVNCTICPADTYQPMQNSSECFSCPTPNSTSVPGSTSLEMCRCAKGYYGTFASDCYACGDRFYKDFAGPATACSVCPDNTRSVLPRGNITDCLCIAGHASARGPGTRCDPCRVGTYAPGNGTVVCTQCPNFTTTAGTGTKDVDACVCMRGYTPSEAWWQGTGPLECVPCAQGTYKDVIGNLECRECPEGSTSLEASVARTDCTCQVGTERVPNADGACGCAVGFYRHPDFVGDPFCVACPPNATSPPRSADISQCALSFGFLFVVLYPSMVCVCVFSTCWVCVCFSCCW
jgi:hypothetical protein